MKIVKNADEKNANSVDAKGYEFKLCGGSVEPKDRKVDDQKEDKDIKD